MNILIDDDDASELILVARATPVVGFTRVSPVVNFTRASPVVGFACATPSGEAGDGMRRRVAHLSAQADPS